jgi:anti-anti-sigma factor
MSDSGVVRAYEVELEAGGPEARVMFSGDLDLAARGALVEATDRAVTAAGGRRVVLDLSEVRRIDSTGLRDLIEAVLRCDQAEADWELIASDEVERLLVLVRFGRRRSDGGQGWVAGGGYTEE